MFQQFSQLSHSSQETSFYNISYLSDSTGRKEDYLFIFQYIQKYQYLILKEVMEELREKWSSEKPSWKLKKFQILEEEWYFKVKDGDYSAEIETNEYVEEKTLCKITQTGSTISALVVLESY